MKVGGYSILLVLLLLLVLGAGPGGIGIECIPNGLVGGINGGGGG